MKFDLPGGVHALFTTRANGNLSTLRGERHEQGLQERERLCAQLGLRWLCASRQVHGSVVQRVRVQTADGGQPLTLDADGHATALRGVGMMVLVADCLPVLLASEQAVAALHAGWRGLAAGVLEEGLQALRELGGEGELVALIGPGAGPCCYEVGEEVHAACAGGRRASGGDWGVSGEGRGAFSGDRRASETEPQDAGRGHRRRHIDLPALAQERLAAAGVTRIERVPICTICDERCFSHRREGERAGRQAGIVWLS